MRINKGKNYLSFSSIWWNIKLLKHCKLYNNIKMYKLKARGPRYVSEQLDSLTHICLSFSSVQSLSHVRLCNRMNRSTPGLPVHQQLPESTQTHVHWVGDAIQPSHPLSSPSPPAPNLSQHQGLFQWVNSSHQVAKVLEFQLQYYFFQ